VTDRFFAVGESHTSPVPMVVVHISIRTKAGTTGLMPDIEECPAIHESLLATGPHGRLPSPLYG
jgi:hypothetical protein